MRDPQIIKILHGCDEDLKLLMSDYGIIVVNLFDTTRALEFIQKIPALKDQLKGVFTCKTKDVNQSSLNKIIMLFVDVPLDKFFQVSDWRVRPLPYDQMHYARNDSHFLIPVYLIMIQLLTYKGIDSLCVPDGVAKLSDTCQNNFLKSIREASNAPEGAELFPAMVTKLADIMNKFQMSDKIMKENYYKRYDIKVLNRDKCLFEGENLEQKEEYRKKM